MQGLTLIELLDVLVDEHDRIGSPLPGELLPGVDGTRVTAALAEVGLTPGSELLELFAWHDYQAPGSAGRTTWFWPAAALRLDEAIAAYRQSVEIGGVAPSAVGDSLGVDQPSTATFTGFWRTDWFPILESSPESYAVECPNAGGTSPGAVWRVVWHPDPGFETKRVARSLAEFVERVLELFRAGAYRWDEEYKAIVTVDSVFEARGLGSEYRPFR